MRRRRGLCWSSEVWRLIDVEVNIDVDFDVTS
jgi:hypothetical protein